MWLLNGAASLPVESQLDAMCVYAFNAYKTHFLPICHQDVHLHEVELIYYGADGTVLGGSFVGDAAGGFTGPPLTAQVATCVSWTVRQRYRGGHPRTYLPPPDANQAATHTTWSSTHQTNVAQRANDFHTEMRAYAGGEWGDVQLGTVSFVLDREWRDQPTFRGFNIGGARVDGRIDTQRRRLGPDV